MKESRVNHTPARSASKGLRDDIAHLVRALRAGVVRRESLAHAALCAAEAAQP